MLCRQGIAKAGRGPTQMEIRRAIMAYSALDNVLEALGTPEDCLSDAQLSDLDRDGFLVLPLNPKHLQRYGTSLEDLRDVTDALYEKEGWRGGWEGFEFVIEREQGKMADPGSRRLGNLVNKHPAYRALLTMPEVLVAARHIIGPNLRVSAVDMREPTQFGGRQKIHLDWEPRLSEDDPFRYMFCFFVIDDMNKDNGALRVIPGTHTRLDYPDEYIDTSADHPDEIFVEAEAATRIIVNSLIWHSGSQNTSGARRRTFFTEYRERSLPQSLNQQLYVSQDVIDSLEDAHKWLLSVGDDFPVEEVRHYGPGDAYRRRYTMQSAHETGM